MIYPKFLKEGSTIGICAPSAGAGHKLDDYLKSIETLINQGYKIKETNSVRSTLLPSTTAKKRANEMHELFLDEDTDFIMCATGGDFMIEILPHIDFDLIKNNPKWIMGYSDPTNILFPITTKLDIATLYGYNGGSYDDSSRKDTLVNLKYIKGDITKQNSYKKYISAIDYYSGKKKWDKDVKWLSKNDIDVTGRCIGGCLDVIVSLIGSDFIDVEGFIERYKDDGIVWYFDVFAMSSSQLYYALVQMKNAGFFKHTKAILFGRFAFYNEDDTITYDKAIKRALKNIPYITEMDIGHTNPMMTMINGAIINVKYSNNKGSINFKLK